jgi:hypothetical protein
MTDPLVSAESAHGSEPAACAAEVCAPSPSVGPSPSSDPAQDASGFFSAGFCLPRALLLRRADPCTHSSPDSGSFNVRKVQTPIRHANAITPSAFPYHSLRLALNHPVGTALRRPCSLRLLSSALPPSHTAAPPRTNAPLRPPAPCTPALPTSPQKLHPHVSCRTQTPPPPSAHTESKPFAFPRSDKMHDTFSFGNS